MKPASAQGATGGLSASAAATYGQQAARGTPTEGAVLHGELQ
jgi:hypothetical protein